MECHSFLDVSTKLWFCVRVSCTKRFEKESFFFSNPILFFSFVCFFFRFRIDNLDFHCFLPPLNSSTMFSVSLSSLFSLAIVGLISGPNNNNAGEDEWQIIKIFIPSRLSISDRSPLPSHSRCQSRFVARRFVDHSPARRIHRRAEGGVGAPAGVCGRHCLREVREGRNSLEISKNSKFQASLSDKKAKIWKLATYSFLSEFNCQIF